MGTTAEKLTYLSETKAAIAVAITDKGVEVPEETTFREYADLISSIKVGSSLEWVTVYQEGSISNLQQTRAPNPVTRLAVFSLPSDVAQSDLLYKIDLDYKTIVMAGKMSNLVNSGSRVVDDYYYYFEANSDGTYTLCSDGPYPMSIVVQYAVLDNLLEID